MSRTDSSQRYWTIAGLAILAVVFVIDIVAAVGVVASVLYVLVSLCALRVSARFAIGLAALATLANVLGYCFSPVLLIPEWIVVLNRVASIFATWLLIGISLRLHRDTQATITRLKENAQQRELLALMNRRSTANEMAATLAHELNQPLATISVYAEGLLDLLRSGQVEPSQLAKALSPIHSEALRAGQIVRDLRTFVESRASEFGVIDVHDIIGSVKRICEMHTLSAGIPIEVDIDGDLPPVTADSVQLQQVLVNLVNNALEASTDVPAERKRITIRAFAQTDAVEVCVIDRGCGIDSQQLDDIFEPYYTTKPHGLGIGLNICRSIVEDHGGKLWASQNVGAGLTFHILLPRATEEAPS